MDRVYVKSCGEFSAGCTNWNEAYQLALEKDDSTLKSASARQAELMRVEKAFEEEALKAAMKIVLMEADAPRQVPQALLCYRDKNVLFRVLPDCRSGRSIVAALRGVLLSGSSVLTVPLTVFFVYRGTPVLAQALAPLGPEPQKLHGDDAEPNAEVVAEVEIIADALNTPLPDQIVCEVYRGLDGRKYVANTNITTIALDDSTLISGPLKRTEMLVLSPCVTATCEDTLNVLRNPAVMDALLHVLDAPLEQQGHLLSGTLHFYGINLCLLKGVLDAFQNKFGDDAPSCRGFAEAVAIEMMARTIKQEFYTEVQGKRLGMDDVGISKCLALHLRAAFHDEGKERFASLVLRKYSVGNGNGEAETLRRVLREVRREHRSLIVERVSWLVGARSALPVDVGAYQRTVVWISRVASRITPPMREPSLLCSLEPLFRNSPTCEAHVYAFCCPVQIKVAVWQRRMGDALNLASAAAEHVSARYGPASIRAVQAQRTFAKLLFGVPALDNIREALQMVTPMLQVYEDRAGPVTRARCHIEVGCCLLGASSVLDVLGEAAQHFRMAERLLPAWLRSSSGAWLYLQPSFGLVRCHQLGQKSASVPLTTLVGDAVYFSRVVAPADYCTEYLWELGMELAADRDYEEATQVLTAAYAMAKRTPQSVLDVEGLRDDTFRVYSEWDPEHYAAYCAAVAENSSA
ncbi:hypothetical protein ABB37_06816 [Leptomonas pyrrhocoris]|uniref:Clu domain-containing protein n=1 Tax=Leptomonas pyrrhocoris TaxID=157538 RepID=A0A0N0DTW8_LEPPY|nr:hypothetical protein ABB37_06816 [Leptomonas pyrrhocoris]KPA78088.1 hypothetical protein ABB37_06816 [Leptomonas pyrrhocoris]|eukprot:XP_015656527.1 hypothetical protein ABB37_06816 [Leptomonas pyrrhocoris]